MAWLLCTGQLQTVDPPPLSCDPFLPENPLPLLGAFGSIEPLSRRAALSGTSGHLELLSRRAALSAHRPLGILTRCTATVVWPPPIWDRCARARVRACFVRVRAFVYAGFGGGWAGVALPFWCVCVRARVRVCCVCVYLGVLRLPGGWGLSFMCMCVCVAG